MRKNYGVCLYNSTQPCAYTQRRKGGQKERDVGNEEIGDESGKIRILLRDSRFILMSS